MPTNCENLFTLLKTRKIYDILDGDIRFNSSELDEEVGLPYLSGPNLIKILSEFGKPSTYDSRSRWVYVEELLDHCIAHGRVSDMFAYFFDIGRFHKDFQGLSTEEINRKYKAIIAAAIDTINSELVFGGHELRRTGNAYTVASIGAAPMMETPSIKVIDRPYIKDMAERAQQGIEQGDCDSVLPKPELCSKRCSAGS